MLPKEINVSFVIRPRLWLLSPLAVLCVLGLAYVPWDAKNAPAWVQAVGSVLAILVSIWVAGSADRRAERARKARELVALAAIAHVINAVQGDAAQLRWSLQVLWDRGEWTQTLAVQASLAAMLEGLDLTEVTSPDVVRDVFYIRNTLRFVESQVLILIEDPKREGPIQTIELNCGLLIDASRKLLGILES